MAEMTREEAVARLKNIAPFASEALRVLLESEEQAQRDLRVAEVRMNNPGPLCSHLKGHEKEAEQERDRLKIERDNWQEEARRYCQNADHHREKREAAEAEVERLTRERNAWFSSSKDHHDEAKDLRALVGELREALEKGKRILKKHGPITLKDYVEPALARAREALKEKVTPEEIQAEREHTEELKRKGVL